MAQLSTEQKGILYMFEKPAQPLYMPRAGNQIMYNLPQEKLPEGLSVSTRFGHPGVSSINIDWVVDANSLPWSIRSIARGTVYSHFIPSHRRAARELANLFESQKGLQGLLNYAANIRDSINETLFIYALSFVILRNPEYRKMGLPSIVETMPADFIPRETLDAAEQKLRMAENMDVKPERVVVQNNVDLTGTNLNAENRLAYWREDYGINSHHWHWHLIFPAGMGNPRDRKGEIFYYMHQQMIARYDMERLCHDLVRVEPLQNWREPIPNGYYSKLTLLNSGRNWGVRQDNTSLSDYTRTDGPVEPFTINDLELWRHRLLDGIHQGFFVNTKGEKVPLTDDVNVLKGERRGIDIVGETCEADSDTSENYRFYGDLHTYGHIALGVVHDPTGKHNEEISVVGYPSTAMRDPVFYRWHRFIDDIFQVYKLTQKPYPQDELIIEGIRIKRFGIQSGNEGYLLTTFHDTKTIEASRGLDFKSGMAVDVEVTRINHEPFKYHILVENTKQIDKEVTVRIFLAPKFNETGAQMDFMDQRSFWSEMDKFKYKLQPGDNHITRNSTDSSITIPDELTFRDLEKGPDDPAMTEAFCGCGWPQHALIPRGKEEGMQFQLFVILSDFSLDKMSDQKPSKARCGKPVSFCGLLDEKFPDRRAMGFPFDRRPLPEIATVKDFAVSIPNSAVEDVKIKFTGRRTTSSKDP